MAVQAQRTRIMATMCLMLICLFSFREAQAESGKPPKKDFLVASGLTKEAVAAITNILQQNKIPFSTEGIIGAGERFEVSGDTVANQAFILVKSLKSKFSKEDLVIPDQPIGRTQLDYYAIAVSYDFKGVELFVELAQSRGLPVIGGEGDTVTGYSIECKKEASADSIAILHDFAKLHPEIHIQIFDQPYPLYNYDEPVPSANIRLH
jgi:hypothetical protein